MSKGSFNIILLDNDAPLDNSNFLVDISLSTHAQILNKSNDGICNSFKHNDSNIEKIKNYIKQKFNEVALNLPKNQTIKELALEMYNKSIETTNPNSFSLLKEHVNGVENEIYFLRDELRVKNDLIKSLFSLKSAENSVVIQTSDTIYPKNPLNEMQKEKKNANKNLVNNFLISTSLETSQRNLKEISNTSHILHVELSFVS